MFHLDRPRPSFALCCASAPADDDVASGAGGGDRAATDARANLAQLLRG
jgi:hypothetical protein